MEAPRDGESWMGHLEYPNDRLHIIGTLVLLPIASLIISLAVVYAAFAM